jgi:hypothetical protein
MLNTKTLLNDIFISTNQGDKYIIFEHDDKTWVMPKTALKTALGMYQPPALKGKILKKMVLHCNNLSFFAHKLGVSETYLSVNRDILQYIGDCLGKEDFYIAGYMGDTSSRQNNKVTLQIYDDKHLICYAKITKDLEVAKTFRHEILAFKFLEDKGIANVPRILGEEKIDGMNIFIQTTEKITHEKVCLKFEKQQIDFVKSIVDATKVELSYEETEFYNVVQYLKLRLDSFDSYEKSVLADAIEKIETRLTDKKCEYSFSHGDYTPWNVYYSDGKLNGFDFEYCSYSMPCYIDVFHYLTQMSVLGFGNGAKKTIRLYEKNKELLEQYDRDTDFTYLCYLVFIVSFYKKRTQGRHADIRDKYEKWIGIIEYLNEKLK